MASIFTSLAPGMVEQSVIRAKWEAERDRMDEAADRMCLYSDDYEAIIEDALSKLFCKENYDRLKVHINGSQNILKRVVDELSMVYKTKATRVLSAKSDRWDAIMREGALDVRMKRANRLTNLLNDTIVKAGVRSGRIVYDIITPDICTVIQNEEDPTRIAAALWYRTLVNTPSSAALEYEYMDDLGWWVVLDKDFRITKRLADPSNFPYRDANGAPLLPLVPVHRQHPESSFWDQDSGRDLYNAAVGVGWKLTLKDYYFKTASFKQLYAVGNVNIPQDQVSDPQTFINVKTDPDTKGEVGVLDLQIDIDKLVQSLVFDINGVINNYGISADMWTLTVGEMSGRALKIRNRALLERREEQLPTYREAESELFERTKAVNNAHASFFGWERIPDEATLETDFAEVEFPEDPLVERDIWDRDLKRGAVSLGQYYMHFNPDMKDEKAAERKAIKNLETLRALVDKHPTLDQALNDIIGGGGGQGANGEAGGQGDPFGWGAF